MEDKKAIKNNLRKYRIWKNITQSQLAIELVISIGQLRNIECRCKYPKYHVRSKICKYFRVSQGQMFYEEE